MRKENIVVEFLSRVPIVADSLPVGGQFSDEHLFAVIVKTPWYADAANCMETRKLPAHLPSWEKKLIVQRSA